MAADLAAFRAEFPEADHAELGGASDTTVERCLRIAKDVYVSTERGTLYLTAHEVFLFEKEKTWAGDGIRTSEGMGPHSESYRPADTGNPRIALYDTTSYGRTYLRLRRAATAARVSIIKGGS